MYDCNMRILVVDDEPFNLVAMQTLLKKAFVKSRLDDKIMLEITDFVTSGQKAIDKINQGFKYGLIVTDISMPVMDGFVMSKQIREIYRHKQIQQPYIVACTGHTEDMYVKKAWRYLLDEVMPKPAKIEVLSEIINQVVMFEEV